METAAATKFPECLAFDDTVLQTERYSRPRLTRRRYGGNEHRVIRGIGLMSCVYVNGETGGQVVDYRFWPGWNGQSKLDHVAEMLTSVVCSKQLPFNTVLMDSWYATQKFG